MKVAVLSRVAHPLHGYGGLERHVGAMVRYLAREGADVTLYTSPPAREGVGIEGVRIEPVTYRSIPWPRRAGFVIAERNTNYLLWSLRVAEKVLGDAVDVVHAEAGAGFGYARRVGPGQPPFVLQAQGMEEFKTRWIKRWAYAPLRWATRYAAKRAHKVIVPDRSMEEEVQRYLGVEPGRTHTLPLAIDLDAVDRPIPEAVRRHVLERWNIGPKAWVLLSVGRLEANKGFDVLAEALALSLSKLGASWKWVLVGEGPERGRLEALVREVSIFESCRLVGRLSDEELAALYERADLFVHPTLYEGSSLVTLEAMAHRKPVVASCVGGIPDKVVEAKTGFLVAAGDSSSLADALVRARSLGAGLAELGAEGRRRVESHFNWTGRARRLIELYREVSRSRQR